MSAKNVRVGTGKTIHAACNGGRNSSLSALCGSGSAVYAQFRFHASPLTLTDKPVTCKRCLAILAQK